MTPEDLQTLVSLRLEHFASRIDHLYSVGLVTEAELLREEGLMLAEAYDNENTFLFA